MRWLMNDPSLTAGSYLLCRNWLKELDSSNFVFVLCCLTKTKWKNMVGSVIIPAASRSNIAGPVWVFFSWLSPICCRGSDCRSFVALTIFIHGRGQDSFQTAPLHLLKGWMWKQSLLCTTVGFRPHLLCFCLWSSQGWWAAVVDFVDSL